MTSSVLQGFMLVMSCGDVKTAADIGVATLFITCSGGSAGAKITGMMGWIAAGMAARTLAAGSFGTGATMVLLLPPFIISSCLWAKWQFFPYMQFSNVGTFSFCKSVDGRYLDSQCVPQQNGRNCTGCRGNISSSKRSEYRKLFYNWKGGF